MIDLETLLAPILPKKKLNKSTEKSSDISKIIAGEFIAEKVFCVRKDYAFGDTIGEFALKKNQIESTILNWANVSEIDNISDLLFIDTETTGLSGGTGTYPFLVGIGYFTETGFRVEQYFMNDLSAELQMLEIIISKFNSKTILVSYNGKSFDVNLLNTRFISNGINYPIKNLQHIDLLHLVRRLWKGSFGSCSLQNIEKFVLRSFREMDDEIPGAQIPAVYFEYLEFAKADKLENVFLHNQADIISLAILLNVTSEILSSKLSWKDLMVNPLGLAKLQYDFGNKKKALNLLEEAILEPDCRKYLTSIYKKESFWEKAILHWKDAAADNEIYALVELAKYYEHQLADYSLALHYCEKALEIITNSYWIDPEKLEELAHRKRRLEKRYKIVIDEK